MQISLGKTTVTFHARNLSVGISRSETRHTRQFGFAVALLNYDSGRFDPSVGGSVGDPREERGFSAFVAHLFRRPAGHVMTATIGGRHPLPVRWS